MTSGAAPATGTAARRHTKTKKESLISQKRNKRSATAKNDTSTMQNNIYRANIKATVNKRSEVSSKRRTQVNTITEAELIDFMKNDAVKQLNVTQTQNGKYRIHVKLSWKMGNWHLITARGKVRAWVSLDRLQKHIREKYDGKILRINLTLSKTVLTGDENDGEDTIM